MEVLGAAAAADQLIKEAFKLVQLIRSIRDKYQGAPKEIEAWRQEIEDLSELIKRIEALPTLDGYDIYATLESCKTTCHDLIGIFSGLDFATGDPRLLKTWMAIKGIDQEPTVRKHFGEIQRLKGTLLLKINVSQFTQGYQTAQDVQFIKAAIQPGTDEDRCLKSLFITDPTDHRDAIITAKGTRVKGTCEWITSTDEYKAWIISPQGLLWLSGGPGKGKTFISIFLTKHLSESTPVIYFFCDNKDATRNTAVTVLRGLLYQLIGQCPRLLHHIFTPWKVQQDALFNSNSFEGLWRIFQTMLEDIGTDLVCVLDGLDEFADDSLTSLLHKIKILFTESPERHKLKLIILSRRHPECLERTLSSFPRIDLDSDQVSSQSDINFYITSRVAQLAERKGMSKSLAKHIEEIFREKSEDTFLWISFMADDLEKQTVSGIEKALETLPKGLDEIYERILRNIKPDNTAIIATMLQWIALVRRPLTVLRLAEAIRINVSGYLSKEELCMSYIESCGHLLQVSRLGDVDDVSQDVEVSDDPSVTFVHQSVKDFLFESAKRHTMSDFQLNKAQGNFNIASQLLASMQNEWRGCVVGPHIGDELFKEIDGHPLALYARWNWFFHLQQLEDRSLYQLINKNTSFFSDSSIVRCRWQSVRRLRISERGDNLLQFACDCELPVLAKRLLKRKRLKSPFTFQRYINHRQEHSRSALGHAINNGSTELVQLLLSYKANLEIPCSVASHSALRYATQGGNLEIFKLLAETKSGQSIIDADIKAGRRGVDHESLLHDAITFRNTQLCDLLLQRYNYDIEEKSTCGDTPVCRAISVGSIGLARMFVEKWNASIAPTDKILKAVAKSRNYLVRRDIEGDLELVISEWKIDINTRDESGWTILHYVFKNLSGLWSESKTIYELAARCLVLGADPSLLSTDGDAPFHIFRWFKLGPISPLRPIVLLLRDGRLDVNDEGNGGNTLLHRLIHGAFGCHEAVGNNIFNGLAALLDIGADRTSVNSDGETALQLAKKLSIQRQGEHVEFLTDIFDVLENYATVSNQPQRLDPLDWPFYVS
ncbi:hypothetical protein V491_03116 [Pseudogymnoascus sp. VKM F-3775]|nr:hypothetical protein V491_03116 [Pseudogymnoascus sp. VKM F-3775]